MTAKRICGKAGNHFPDVRKILRENKTSGYRKPAISISGGYALAKHNFMETKLFYRVANNKTEQGLWYDFTGNFTGLIHNDFNFCMNNQFPMPFDPEIVGWLSATQTLDELFNWFSQNDIAQLEKHGFEISIYEASEFRFHNNHWIIKQDSSRFVERVPLACA